MIEHKLLYYPKKAQFEQEKDNIADTSIAFIEDSGTIYTHKHEFGGNGGGTNTEYTYEISKQYTDDQVTQTVGRIMDAVDAKITDFATRSYVNSSLTAYMQGLNITDKVEQILNAKEPSWSAIVSRIGTLEGQEQNILEQIASIKAQIVDDGNGGSYPQITLETIYNLLNSDDETAKEIAAKIFMFANESGSEIHLEADRIYFGSDTNDNQLKMYIRGAIDEVLSITVTDPTSQFTYATLIAAGLKFQNLTDQIWLTQTEGLRHTDIDSSSDHNGEHGYWLKNDGSGELAFGNITWDNEGNLTTHGLMLAEAEEMGVINSFVIDSVVIYPHGTTINYHLSKSGFIVKQGEVVITDSVPFWEGAIGRNATETNANRKYYANVNGFSEHFYSGSRYGVTTTAYTTTAVNTIGIIYMLHDRNQDVWNSIFKYPSTASESLRNTWVFKDGDTVYMQFPTEIYKATTSPSHIDFLFKSGVTSENYGTEAAATNSEALALVESYEQQIKDSIEEKGFWKPVWSYRLRGQYDPEVTYLCNNQYKDVVYVESGDQHSNYYLCIANNTVGINPEDDTDNEYWCKTDDVNDQLGNPNTYSSNTYQPMVAYSDLSYESRIIKFEGDHFVTWSNNPS